MNTILEDVFLYETVYGDKGVGFATAGFEAPATPIGYIVRHETLKATYVAYACHPTTFLTPSHLKTIAKRLQTLNERQEKAR